MDMSDAIIFKHVIYIENINKSQNYASLRVQFELNDRSNANYNVIASSLLFCNWDTEL